MALAYSYDEIVQMVQAEEKVFGQADYSKSLDTRLSELELRVLGHETQGSDSLRLRRVCRSLGIEKESGSVMAAPFTVVVAAKKPNAAQKSLASANKNHTQTVNSGTLSSLNEAPTHTATQDSAQPVHTDAPGQLLAQAPAHKFETARSKSHKSHNKAGSKQIQALSTQAAAQSALPAAAKKGTVAPATNSEEPNPAIAAILISAIVGVVAICTGLVLFMLLRVRNEVSSPFARGYAYEDNNEGVEEDALEQEEFEQINEELQPMNFLPNLDRSSLNYAEPSHAMAETQHAADYTVDHEAILSRNQYFALNQVLAQSTMPIPEQSKSQADLDLPANSIAVQNYGDFAAANAIIQETPILNEEFSTTLSAMTDEQVNEVIEEFSPAASDPSDDFKYMLDEEEEFAALAEHTANLPSLFSLNVCELTSADESQAAAVDAQSEAVSDIQAAPLTEWPSFEPAVAPSISSVAKWMMRSRSADQARAAQQMLIVQEGYKSSFDATPSSNEDWGDASYRALAQLLIDAASENSCSILDLKPCQRMTAPTGIPQNGKLAVVAQTKGKQNAKELEDILRTLFSSSNKVKELANR